METPLTKHERNLSAIIHASMFSKFFFPFGNFILPLILWLSNKNQHAFVDYHGKQALNFQISILLYSIVAGMIFIPFFVGALPFVFDWNMGDFPDFDGMDLMNIHIDGEHIRFGRLFWPLGIMGLIQVGLSLLNIVFSILATIRTHEGQYFKYPFTIKFIR